MTLRKSCKLFILIAESIAAMLFSIKSVSSQSTQLTKWVEVQGTTIEPSKRINGVNNSLYDPMYLGANTLARNRDQINFEGVAQVRYVQFTGNCRTKMLSIIKVADFDKNKQPTINVRKIDEGWFRAEENYRKILEKACSLSGFTMPSTPKLIFDYKNKKDSGSIEYKRVRASLNYSKRINEIGRIDYSPTLSISIGKQVITVAGEDNLYRSSMVQIAEMDKSNPFPEVIFSSYTGGAHCCTIIKIITSSPDGLIWRVVNAGRFDGGTREVEAPDSGELYYLIRSDNRFLYKFSSYARSFPPMRVWQLNDLELKDISKDTRFHSLHRQTLGLMWKNIKIATESGEVNGLLAGYTATKALLGEAISGWELMLERYDRTRTDGLEVCKSGYSDQGKCKEGLVKYYSFPEALRAFLIDTDYLQ